MPTPYTDIGNIAKNGAWEGVDLRAISTEEINSVKYGVGSMKTNAIGIAAQHNTLDKLPKQLFTKEGLTAPNNSGETPLHFICSKSKSQIGSIPKNLIDKENILIPNDSQTTPLHYLAYHGNLENLMHYNPRLLSSQNLEQPNSHGLSPLDFALFSLENVMKNLSYPPRERKAQQNRIKEGINLIISKVSTKFLLDQLKLPKNSKCYKEKSQIVKHELIKRNLIEEIKKGHKDLEI